jgi:hypothetical protein
MFLGIDATISGELGNGRAQGVVSLQKLIMIAADNLQFAFNFHLVSPLGTKVTTWSSGFVPTFFADLLNKPIEQAEPHL